MAKNDVIWDEKNRRKTGIFHAFCSIFEQKTSVFDGFLRLKIAISGFILTQKRLFWSILRDFEL